MSNNKMFESILCLFAMAAGCFIAVPLGLLGSKLGGKCLLFGEVNSLTMNITFGDQIHCDLGFYSSITNGVLATFLVVFRWCCLVATEKPSMVYGSLISFILATLGWINSIVCTVFMVVGFTEWCRSIEKTGIKISSCKDAEKWDWTRYHPQPIKADMFHTYLAMVEISSYCSTALWFMVALFTGRQLRRWIEKMRFEPDVEYIDGYTYDAPPPHPMDMYATDEYGRVTHL